MTARQTLGIVGGGQLARMAVQAAIPLGVRVRVLAARTDDSAAQVWPDVTIGSPDSLDDLRRFAATCDVLTFDHELVDPAHLAALEQAGHLLRPAAAALRSAQDKGFQRRNFAELGLPVPPFALVQTDAEIAAFAATHGWPLILKSCRGGYDGRGVWRLSGPEDAAPIAAELRGAGVAMLVEPLLAIERELAVLVARRPGGEQAVYPVVETVQRDGICHEVVAPAAIPESLAEEARALAVAIAEQIDAVGILAVELFVVGGGLLINEIALRPHNSGHYSIEGCGTSQFENHLRATLDLPLGDPALASSVAVMANVLGGGLPDPLDALADALAVPGVHVHLYGKTARPGRKLGHVTALGSDSVEVRGRAIRAAALLADGAAVGSRA